MKKKYGDPPLTIRVPRVLIDKMHELAKRKGTTVSNIMRDEIVALLTENGMMDDDDGRMEHA